MIHALAAVRRVGDGAVEKPRTMLIGWPTLRSTSERPLMLVLEREGAVPLALPTPHGNIGNLPGQAQYAGNRSRIRCKMGEGNPARRLPRLSWI